MRNNTQKWTFDWEMDVKMGKKNIKKAHNRTNLVVKPEQKKKLKFLNTYLTGNPKYSPLVRQAIDYFFDMQLQHNPLLKIEWEKVKRGKGKVIGINEKNHLKDE